MGEMCLSVGSLETFSSRHLSFLRELETENEDDNKGVGARNKRADLYSLNSQQI